MKCIPALAVLLLAGCVSATAGNAPQEQQYPQWVLELAERRVEQQQEEPVTIVSSSASVIEEVPIVVAKQPKPTRVRKEVQRPRQQKRDIGRTIIAPTPAEPMTDDEKTAEAVRLMTETAQMQAELQALQAERRQQLEQRQRANAARDKQLRSRLP